MDIPIACTLNRAELSQRQNELATLRQTVRGIRSMTNEFALRFDCFTENLMAIAQVIDKERVCCRFLEFRLVVEPDTGPFWLEVSGHNNTHQLLFELFTAH